MFSEILLQNTIAKFHCKIPLQILLQNTIAKYFEGYVILDSN